MRAKIKTRDELALERYYQHYVDLCVIKKSVIDDEYDLQVVPVVD